MCHWLSRWYLDFQSIMERTCQTTSISLLYSPATSTISEHKQVLICDDEHQIFGLCNWLCMHSCRPRKSTDPQILAHSSKNSSTKKFSWFREFLSTSHTWLQPHRIEFESVEERKWENCLQMDTDTTTSFWTTKKQAFYCNGTCVTYYIFNIKLA